MSLVLMGEWTFNSLEELYSNLDSLVDFIKLFNLF